MSPSDLPRLADIFNQLRRGRHICREDGDLYWVMQEHRLEYENLFSALGFQLECHSREFFFFRGEGPVSKQTGRMALFFFILVEWLADRGDFVERQLLEGEFSIRELPHLQSDRYRATMREADVATPDQLSDVIRGFESLGFAQRLNEQQFRFRTPVLRFVELCHEVFRADSDGVAQEQPNVADGWSSVGVDE